VRGGEAGYDSFVEDGAVLVDELCKAGAAGGEGMTQLEDGLRDGSRLRAGEAHDTDASAAGRRGDGDDGVGVEVHARLIPMVRDEARMQGVIFELRGLS
jgi:hypothetical protein